MDSIEILKAIIGDLSLQELGELTKNTLSMIYSKLREEEGFSCNQCACIETIGEDPWDVRILIINDDSSGGVDYTEVYRI